MIKVAVGIIRENGKVLVCQRKKSARYGLKWEFPGGKVEEGESPLECLSRELKEELNINPEITDLYFRQEYTYPDSSSFEVLYYLIPKYSGTLENRAFEEIRWISEKELTSIDMLEGNREVVYLLAKEQEQPPLSLP